MKNRSTRFLLLSLALLSIPNVGLAQARATAESLGILQIGATAEVSHSNYLPIDVEPNSAPLSDLMRHVNSTGFGVYSNFDFRTHLGVALDFNRTSGQNDSSTQTSVEGGVRYKFLDRGGVIPYARASFGRGYYGYSGGIATVGYNIYGLAGGVDYRLIHSLNIRAEYEYQGWLSVPLRSPQPQTIKLGIAYRFHSDMLTDRLRR